MSIPIYCAIIWLKISVAILTQVSGSKNTWPAPLRVMSWAFGIAWAVISPPTKGIRGSFSP